MKKKINFAFALLLAIIFTSCSEDDNNPVNTGFLHGIYIINEGNFGSNNGSISYFDVDSGKITNNLFEKINGRSPGDVVQSFGIAGDKGFIVVNNSQKVEVVDLESFTSIGIIAGTNYPRYFRMVSDNKGYLTNGSFDGTVFVVDLTSLEITKQISVGKGPENLILYDGIVYIANSGGWSTDSTVSVIDPETDILFETIIAGDNPVDLVADRNGDIWVLCKGKVVYDQNWMVVEETSSEIVVISRQEYSVLKSFEIGEKGDFFNPVHLDVGQNGEYIYYLEVDGIYKINMDDAQVPDSPFVSGIFYGFNINPVTGKIYGFKSNGFLSNGQMFRYSQTGELLDSMEVGIGPNGAIFN